MKKGFLFFTLFAVLLCKVNGQSYHFSQFFATPLLTNPAHTGFIDGPFRVASNFRAQGLNGGSPFLTGYVSGDLSMFQKNLPSGHKAGVGVYLMNDQSLNGALNTNAAGFSMAYNVGLDEEGIYSLGVGLQGTYHQRNLDYSKLRFASQFGSGGYNPSLPIGENFDFYKRSYLDVNAGILYNVNMEDKSFFGGVSVYNILKHKENFFGDEFQMPTRYVLQAGAQFFAGESGKVYVSLTNMNQGKVNTTTLGAAYGIQLTDGDKNEVNFGMWYRAKDALVPYVGYYKGGFQVGLTYDYTVSPLKTGSQVRNGFELTLIFTGAKANPYIPWY